MKSIISAFAAVLFCLAAPIESQAQTTDMPVKSPQTRPSSIPVQVSQYTNKLSRDLNLSEEQHKQLTEQTTANYNYQQSIHEHNMPGNERDQLEQRSMSDHEKKLREIFSDEQYERYEMNRDNYQLEYPRDERLTPTNDQGTQSQQRHNSKSPNRNF